jgi:DNA-binding transcriptional ArsR family regulator
MTAEQPDIDAIFAALGDPTRRKILEALAHRPLTVQELANAFPISRPAVSRHLHRLKEAGLVTPSSSNRKDAYRLAPDGLVVVDLWLTRYRSFWAKRLYELARRFEKGR